MSDMDFSDAPGLDREELDRKKKNRQGTDGFDPDPGRNPVRFLPPSSAYFTDGEGDVAIEFHMHWFKEEGADTRVTRCLRNRDEVCPACKVSQRYYDSDDAALADLADDVSRGRRFAFNLLDLSTNEAGEIVASNKGIQHYIGGKQVYDDLFSVATNPKWNKDGDILHPNNGRSGEVEFTPGNETDSGYNQYGYDPDPDTSDITEYLPDTREEFFQQLDALTSEMADYMEPAEIWTILSVERLGFPVDEDGNFLDTSGKA